MIKNIPKRFIVWGGVALLLLAALFVSLGFGSDGAYRASSTVILVVDDPTIDTGDAVSQFDALDQSRAMGTLVDIFNSSDMHERALETVGVAESQVDRFEIVASNPTDTLVINVDVAGPNPLVAPLSAEVATLGSVTAGETFGEIVLTPVDTTAASVTGGVSPLLTLFIAALFFLGSLSLMTGLPGVVSRSKNIRDTVSGLLAGWIEPGNGDETPPSSSGPELWSTMLVLALAIGLFFTGSVLGVAALLGAFGGLAFLFALRYPVWLTVGLVLLVLFRFSDIGADFYGTPEVSIPYALFVVAVLAVRWLVVGEERTGWIGLSLAIASLVAIMSLSGMTAVDQSTAFEATIDVAKNGLVAIIFVALIRDVADLRAAIWTLIGGTAVLSLLGIVHSLTGNVPALLEGFTQTVSDVVDEEVVGTRLAGPIGDANFFAQVLVTIFPLAVERAWREHSRPLRLLAALAAGLIVWTIVLTFSRGAVIGLLACVVLLVVWLRPSPRLVLVAVSVAAITLFSLPPSYLERIGSIQEVFDVGSQNAPADQSIQGRSSEILVGLHMFHDYPFTGVGPANYPGRYVEYSSDVGIDYRLEARQPHSLPVEVAAELGLVGLSWWFIAVFLLGRGLIRARRQAGASLDFEMKHHIEALTIALVGFGVTALFLHLAFARFLWMMVAISVAAIRIARIHADTARTRLETASA